jgi:hypothetical protein
MELKDKEPLNQKIEQADSRREYTLSRLFGTSMYPQMSIKSSLNWVNCKDILKFQLRKFAAKLIWINKTKIKKCFFSNIRTFND